MTDDDPSAAARAVVAIVEHVAEQRRDAEDFEESGRRVDASQLVALAVDVDG